MKKRTVKNFGKIKETYRLPNMVEVQIKSYSDFLQMHVPKTKRKKIGLEAVFKDAFPIESFDGTHKLEYVSYLVGRSKYTISECRKRGITYGGPLKVKIRLRSPKETREQEGTVLLAVPTDAQVLVYDFSAQLSPNELVWVNAIELLVALDSSREASLSLYMVPDGAQEFATSGLFLPDLVITPGPTPTPTETPFGRPPETEAPITESPTAEGGS